MFLAVTVICGECDYLADRLCVIMIRRVLFPVRVKGRDARDSGDRFARRRVRVSTFIHNLFDLADGNVVVLGAKRFKQKPMLVIITYRCVRVDECQLRGGGR